MQILEAKIRGLLHSGWAALVKYVTQNTLIILLGPDPLHAK